MITAGRQDGDGTWLPLKSRRGGPKSRGGCITCKRRRVKCDEVRPFCGRCTRFGHKCEGYLEKSAQGPSKRAILPSLNLNQPAFTPAFRGDLEYQYFQHFAKVTCHHLSGFYDNNKLWNQIVLQASEADVSLRCAVTAIGALDMTRSRIVQSKNGSYFYMSEECKHGKNAEGPKSHYVFALQQYSKAIKTWQKAVITKSRPLREMLLASLLILCFEQYHGNHESTARHIATSVKLIENQRPIDKSAIEKTIEEEIIQSFNRLEVQAMVHSDPFSLDDHNRFKDIWKDELANIPIRFETVMEARRCFGHITSRSVHCGSIILALKQSEAKLPGLSPSEAQLLDPRAKVHIETLHQWAAAFDHLYQEALANKRNVAPLILRCQYLSQCMILSHFTIPQETSYDEEIETFREIIHLCEISLTDKHFDFNFSFEGESIYVLEIVAQRCRDPALRRQAIHLLRFKPRRESIFDSIITADLSTWVMLIEEEGMVDGHIPEEARLRNVNSTIDLENQEAEIWGYQLKPGSKELVKRTGIVKLSEKDDVQAGK